MRDRGRRRDEPFNPFAANANEVRRRKAKESLHSQASDRNDNIHSQSSRPDFDKRDFLSPLRIAIQEGKKAKEIDNDAQKASQQRNNEAMWSQIDSFIIGLCDLFDIPGQIEKAIRQRVGQYAFSLSVSSFYDYQQYIESAPLEGNRHVGRITSKLSEMLPNMDDKLLMDWVEKLYSIPNYPGKSWKSLEMSSRLLSLSPSQPQRVHQGILTAPEQGTNAFFAHMKKHLAQLHH